MFLWVIAFDFFAHFIPKNRYLFPEHRTGIQRLCPGTGGPNAPPPALVQVPQHTELARVNNHKTQPTSAALALAVWPPHLNHSCMQFFFWPVYLTLTLWSLLVFTFCCLVTMVRMAMVHSSVPLRRRLSAEPVRTLMLTTSGGCKAK